MGFVLVILVNYFWGGYLVFVSADYSMMLVVATALVSQLTVSGALAWSDATIRCQAPELRHRPMLL